MTRDVTPTQKLIFIPRPYAEVNFYSKTLGILQIYVFYVVTGTEV